MPADRAFRFSTYLVVALAGFALGAGGLLSPAMLAVFLVALVATWPLHDALGPRAHLSQRGDVTATLTLTALAVTDFVWFADSFLDTFARLVCALLLVRLATWRVTRELRAAGFLSFSMLAAASAVAFGLAFLPLFITYLATAIVMLVLFHLVTEAEAAGVAPRPVGAGLAIVMGVATVGTLGLTALLFAAIPRVEAALPFGTRSSRALTGFTDRVELGAVGALETDDTVAMRVALPGGAVPEAELRHLRWRGITLDRFDGYVWTSTPRRLTALRAHDGERIELGRIDGPTYLLTQEVFLEPIGTETIFAASPIVRLKVEGMIRLDDSGGLSAAAARARLTYTAESALGARPVERLGFLSRERYLQLPPTAPRIAELARRITAGSPNAEDAAGRLSAWLSRELRYSLDLQRRTALQPLDEFLFVRRAGNCEYFASALAVMLRAVGIPARVVNGFQRGEWNPYGGYWVVRMRDAHSWVEAHVGIGWITLDPSPRGDAPGAPLSTMQLYVDGLRMRWYRYVVGWSRQDQVQAAGAVRRLAWSFPSAPEWSGATGMKAPWVFVACGAVAGVAVVWAVRQRRGAARAGVPAFYARALARLARRGLRPAPHETAREFCVRARREAPETMAALSELTVAYEAVRFGHRALTASEERALTAAASRV